MFLTESSVKIPLLPSFPYLIAFCCQKILGILQNSRATSRGGMTCGNVTDVWHIKQLGNIIEKYNRLLKAKQIQTRNGLPFFD